MSIQLKNSVVCVTGGGRGIGAATARALAKRGAIVMIGDIDFDCASKVAESIGNQAEAFHLDVADVSSFKGFIEAAKKHGLIQLLVNNAGIQRTGAFVDQDLDIQLREISINLGGVVTGVRLVLPDMLAQNKGHIVNVSSMAGKMTIPGAAVYTASKFGVASLSRAIRSEISKSNVTLTTIFPSAVTTELTAGLDVRGVPKAKPEDVAAEIIASCQHGEPEVTIPKWLFPVGAIEQAIPEKVGSYVKRLVGAQDRISASNTETEAYQNRTAKS